MTAHPTPDTTTGTFIPSQAWLDEVKAELPLNTIIRLLRHIVPQILELTAKVGLLAVIRVV